MNLAGASVAVTGASSGSGRETALELLVWLSALAPGLVDAIGARAARNAGRA